jgi:hypothetical protein
MSHAHDPTLSLLALHVFGGNLGKSMKTGSYLLSVTAELTVLIAIGGVPVSRRGELCRLRRW